MDYDAVSHFHQPPGGYRFSADSIHLARFADLRGVRKAADLGAGCGVLGLAALEMSPAAAVDDFFFVELQEDLAASLALNLGLYQAGSRARLKMLAADWRHLTAEDFGGPLDYVLSNPPYAPPGLGRPSPRPGVEAARREIYGSLADLLAALGRIVGPGGRAALSLPARRRAEFLRLCAAAGWRPGRRETIQYLPGGLKELDLWELGPVKPEDAEKSRRRA
ncbi:MAG: methyltransferase [Candidatus Adiutrix sp.]|jgi:tRNA1(Val) A37 N6-methylase TrmN6|nr:methyltransferase [Candidatus Adiutrix sp.]